MRLRLLDGELAVCRLAPGAPVPEWGWTGAVACVTRTAAETSIVCDAASVPAGTQAESGWRAFAIEGPIPFGLTGVLAAVLNPLAAAGIGIFAVSTYDTDYVLVRSTDAARSAEALRAAGHVIL